MALMSTMTAAATARATRAIAFATTIIVLATGLLARHHEAEVAHVTDTRTGVTSHALESECHDTETVLVSHFHALPSLGHADACEQTAAIHQPVVLAKVIPQVAQLQVIERATAPPIGVVAQSPLLLSAPKTSPPARA